MYNKAIANSASIAVGSSQTAEFIVPALPLFTPGSRAKFKGSGAGIALVADAHRTCVSELPQFAALTNTAIVQDRRTHMRACLQFGSRARNNTVSQHAGRFSSGWELQQQAVKWPTKANKIE